MMCVALRVAISDGPLHQIIAKPKTALNKDYFSWKMENKGNL